MSVVLNNDGTLSITAMSLVEFLPEIETAIHQGFMLDVEKNEGVPQSFGSMLVLTMYPCGVEVAGEEHEVALEKALKEDVQDTALFTKDEQQVKVQGTVEGYFSEAVIPPLTDAAPKIDGRKKKS